MKYYKILTVLGNLFSFERIKKILFFLFFVKVVGVPSFLFVFYSFFVNRKSIIDSLDLLITAFAGSPKDDPIHLAYLYCLVFSLGWLSFISWSDDYIRLMDFSPEMVIAELCKDGVIMFDTTIEEAVEYVKNRQLAKAGSYSYPWNKLYEFQVKNSGLVDTWGNFLQEFIEELKEYEEEKEKEKEKENENEK